MNYNCMNYIISPTVLKNDCFVIFQGLQHPFSGRTEGSGGPLTLKRYKIDNCSTSAAQKATFVVKQLNVTPDPVVLPGELTFQFDIDVLTDMDDLQVQL